MKQLDFLSSSTSIYLLKEKRGKNKLGGFFSIFFALAMIALILYYLISYFLGLEYNLTYYRNNWAASFTKEQKIELTKPKSFILYIRSNPNNAKIIPMIELLNSNLKPLSKCDKNSKDETYCFNLSFLSMGEEYDKNGHKLLLYCSENCAYPNGEPAEIQVEIHLSNLELEHSKQNPINELEEGTYKFKVNLPITNEAYYNCFFDYTPIMYNSSEVLSTKIKTHVNYYLTNIKENFIYQKKTEIFAEFAVELNNDCDIYIREYLTLLDTLSKIGGLFSPFKLLFEVLMIIYSDFEINSEITKNVFSKIKNYNFKPINDISKGNDINNTNIKSKKEDLVDRKKFNINKGEQFFCGFFNFKCFNCVKKRRTMKILNSCSDFVESYLSAENIIFNMILFENFYKDNPIKYYNNPFLNKIDLEIEENMFGDKENKEENNGKNAENENLGQGLIIN